MVNDPGPKFTVHGDAIRVPLSLAKGLPDKTTKRTFAERCRNPFNSIADFHRRVHPLPEEMEIIIRAGAFDEFGEPRTKQFWAAQFRPSRIRDRAGRRKRNAWWGQIGY
jgi:DNA polymerase III alpha subunit